MVRESKLKLDVSSMVTRDREEVKVFASDGSEGKLMVAHNYHLARDKARKKIVPPLRYDHADLISYALNVVEVLRDSQTKTFKETFKIKDSKKMVEGVE